MLVFKGAIYKNVPPFRLYKEEFAVVSWCDVYFGWGVLHVTCWTRIMSLYFRPLSVCFCLFGVVSLPLEEFWKLLSICASFKSGLDCYADIRVQASMKTWCNKCNRNYLGSCLFCPLSHAQANSVLLCGSYDHAPQTNLLFVSTPDWWQEHRIIN